MPSISTYSCGCRSLAVCRIVSPTLLKVRAMPQFPTLVTDRLILRELGMADAPKIFMMYSDPTAMRYFGSDPLASLQDAEDLIRNFATWREASNPGVRWGIVIARSGELIGTCGLYSWNRDWQKCSTGYELAREAWGQGYMSEALREGINWGMQNMWLNRIEVQIHPNNARSFALARRLGFKQEGLMREVARWGAQFHDLILLSLLRKDWDGSAQTSSNRSFTTIEAAGV